MEKAVVQPAFGEPIGLLVIKIRFRKQLPGEKARAVETLQADARRATALLRMSDRRLRWWHANRSAWIRGVNP